MDTWLSLPLFLRWLEVTAMLWTGSVNWKQSKGNSVRLRPQQVLYTYLGYSTAIDCYSNHKDDSIIEYRWTLNETQPTDVIIENSMNPGFSRLKIINTPAKFNGSTFRCKITFSNLTTITSYPTTLYIQGILQPVQNINLKIMDALYIGWDSPFSYDVVDIYPDFTFCLEINISSLPCSSKSIFSVCNLTSVVYHYIPLMKHFCYTFTVTVLASNFVGNSTVSEGSLSHCVEKLPSCMPLPTIENGVITSISDAHLSVGTRAVILCNEGYAPFPPLSTLVCNQTLQWEPEIKSITCTKLPSCRTNLQKLGFREREAIICIVSFTIGYFVMWIVGIIYCFSKMSASRKSYLNMAY